MNDAFLLLAYAVPALPIWGGYSLWRRRRHKRSVSILEDATEAGLVEPASLHPSIDAAMCIGCGACALACPEGDVLGLIDGKAQLIDPTRCIGHGACATACPGGAIELVFGTATRGVEIPSVSPEYESSVQGIFIAGELGGMGLIRNAVRQGVAAIDEIGSRVEVPGRNDDTLDVLIIGAGPAGIAASLAAKAAGLRALTVEQDTLGGTVAHYPRAKIAMTEPFDLPLYGRVTAREISKEELISIWTDVVESSAIPIQYGVRVTSIERQADHGFSVASTAGQFKARHVLLAIGRRGTPRKLGAPGEDLPKVVYRLGDPEQYHGQNVMVVGGGDSAVEAALALAEDGETDVVLAYRRKAFSRVRRKNRELLEERQAQGRLTVITGAEVDMIVDQAVILKVEGAEVWLRNDAVIICAGGVLPAEFLRSAGIEVMEKFGTA